MKLYGIVGSPPTRAVMLAGKALALNLKLTEIDMFEKEEHKKDWFLKLNPNHTVPVLDDDGFHLWESRAILAYLVNKYGKDDRLYPREATARALVDNMLYFDMGSVYQNICDYLFAPTFENAEVNPKKGEALKEKLVILNQILESRPYTAGDHVTIADFSFLQSISSLDSYSYKLSPYPAIQKWYKKLQSELPYYKECMNEGVEELRKLVKPVAE